MCDFINDIIEYLAGLFKYMLRTIELLWTEIEKKRNNS